MASRRAQQAVLAGVLALLAAALVLSDAVAFWERDVFDLFSRHATGDERSEQVALIMLDEASLDWGRAFFEQARAQAAQAAGAGLAPGAATPVDGGPQPFGREFLFPWDRSVYSLLVDFCIQGGARALVFDVELAGPHPSGDGAGEASLGLSTFMQNGSGSPFVVHAFNLESSAGATEDVQPLDEIQLACLKGAAIEVDGWRSSGLPFERSDRGPYANPVLPYSDILAALKGDEGLTRLGGVMAQPDPDGVIRRSRPFVVYDGQVVPSLGMAAALAWLEARDGAAPTLSVQDGELLLRRARAGATAASTGAGASPGPSPGGGGAGLLNSTPLRLPLTASGDLLLRWRDDGQEDPSDPDVGRFPTYPAHRVLRSYMKSAGIPGYELGGAPAGYFMDPAVLAGRMVFLGANAAGLRDLKATPVSRDYPGVKVHAAVAEALLDGAVMSRPDALPRGLAAAALAAAALLFTTALRSQLASSLAALALALAWVLLAQAAFAAGLWLDVVAPVLGIGLSYSAGTTWHWFSAGRKSREIAGLFQHFAPPAVVKRLIASPDDLLLRGENREISAFFSDIQGFTSISNTEQMRASPELLTDHLNAYLSVMTAAITSCGGTIDKYIGDAVVAIFGAPLDQPDHAARACRAALLCSSRLEAFNQRAQADGLPSLVTRIGLCSGPAIVGCVGSRERFSYTAIGSTVNFASRMEGVNKTYKTLLLAAGSTRAAAGDSVRARLLDSVRVPGLVDQQPALEVHELLPPDSGPDEAHCRRFEAARALYAAGRFGPAAEAFAALPDDPPARVLYDRCLLLAKSPPPPGWDGAQRLVGK